jgi:fimbrial chaperone protein
VGRVAQRLSIVAANLLIAVSAQAASLRVFPIRVELTAGHPIEVLTVGNNSDTPVSVQMQLAAWNQRDDIDQFEPTRDILANPAIFRIPPGGQQIIRVGLRVTPAAREGSYRVFLQELPSNAPAQSGQVQTLLRLSVPIFTHAKAEPAHLRWRITPRSDGKADLWASNDGDAHIQIHTVTLTDASGRALASQPMSLYILPGAWRHSQIPLTAPLTVGAPVTLQATTDAHDISVALTVAGPGEDGPP